MSDKATQDDGKTDAAKTTNTDGAENGDAKDTATGTLLTGDGKSDDKADEEAKSDGEKSEKSDEGESQDGAEASDDKGDGSDDGDDEEAEGAPEKYEPFELPDGMDLDQAALDAVEPIFRELNLTQEQAQRLVSYEAEQRQAYAEQVASQWQETREAWVQEVKDDPDVGGDSLPETMGLMKALMSDEMGLATPEFRADAVNYGFGDNPHVVRFAAATAKLLKKNGLLPVEDKTVTGKAAQERQSKAEAMFPSMANP